MQAQSAQSLRASASQQHYAFWSACFRRRANCYNKHTFCRSRQKWVSRCKIIVEKKCAVRASRNLKLRAPFCSTLQLSRSFKMLSRSYNGGFFGNSFWCVPNYCLYRAAQRGLHSIGKAALLSRRSRSRTRTSRVHSLLVAQTE